MKRASTPTATSSPKRFRELFGVVLHPFTGMDYIGYYRTLAEELGTELEIILANDARVILPYTDQVLCADIHSRARSKRLLEAAGARRVYTPRRCSEGSPQRQRL